MDGETHLPLCQVPEPHPHDLPVDGCLTQGVDSLSLLLSPTTSLYGLEESGSGGPRWNRSMGRESSLPEETGPSVVGDGVTLLFKCSHSVPSPGETGDVWGSEWKSVGGFVCHRSSAVRPESVVGH